MDLPTDLGIGLVGTMIIGLRFQPPNLTQDENFDQAIRFITTSVEIDLLSEGSTLIATMIDIMITKRDHHISRIKINLELGEVTITNQDRLAGQYKIHLSKISADNTDKVHLTLQCLSGLEIEFRATIYPTKRKSQLPTTVTNQTSFDSLQQTIQWMNYLDYAL